MRRVLLSVVALVAGVALLTTAAPAGTGQKKGGTLRIARLRDLDSVDPALAYSIHERMIHFATCAQLYTNPDKPAPEGLTVIPEVARGFPVVSKDRKIELNRTLFASTTASRSRPPTSSPLSTATPTRRWARRQRPTCTRS